MTPRKPAGQELTREMIIDVARKQFLEKSFQEVSMRVIATELACSHGAIYYHFKNKASLFYAVVEEYFAELDTLLANTLKEEGEPDTKLIHIFLCLMRFGLNNQSQYEYMFVMRNEEVNSLSQEAASKSYAKFAQAVHPLCRESIMLSDIYSVFMALHGFIVHHLHHSKNFDEVKEIAFLHAQFLMKAIR
ncbi:TetR/AcrR family transcriptional regulator [Lysinibacillus piscis]|uniref:HTH tetR-type domain-containing protein n=1 Tax=Lysinibacillus piscis TaxID=2518931 RepID=A0ABQ5NKM6_9BACI|nr:TetR/AcrR family transcriptional regulator [Lysinibacillus sp. KH24]GLC88914.1 hypothetical protein LYSBPC_20410 [Lysinibacillus sp. KH24]